MLEILETGVSIRGNWDFTGFRLLSGLGNAEFTPLNGYVLDYRLMLSSEDHSPWAYTRGTIHRWSISASPVLNIVQADSKSVNILRCSPTIARALGLRAKMFSKRGVIVQLRSGMYASPHLVPAVEALVSLPRPSRKNSS